MEEPAIDLTTIANDIGMNEQIFFAIPHCVANLQKLIVAVRLAELGHSDVSFPPFQF